MKRAWLWVSWMGAGLALAQTASLPPETPTHIEAQRQRLAVQRAAIEQDHQAQTHACWQRFAVNDCLMAVRRSRFAQLDPVREQELALNALERQWRTQERQRRLQEKAPGQEKAQGQEAAR